MSVTACVVTLMAAEGLLKATQEEGRTGASFGNRSDGEIKITNIVYDGNCTCAESEILPLAGIIFVFLLVYFHNFTQNKINSIMRHFRKNAQF